MALNRIWVHAEAADGKVSPLTLELLAKARTLGGTVEAVYAGDDADAVAGTLGATGATTVLATGPREGSLPGVPVASASAGAVAAGNGPDLIMFGTGYNARDIAARLSVALDKPVITNNIDIEVSGDDVIVTEPVFGGVKLVKTKFTAGVVEPRYPSFKGIMAAKSKPVEELALADLGIDAASVGSAGAGQEIVAVEDAPVREAGEIVEDDGEAFAKIVAFLDGLKVI